MYDCHKFLDTVDLLHTLLEDVMIFLFRFVFFKQKTEYEMRISDWSSDVCSSDLPLGCASNCYAGNPSRKKAFGPGRRRPRCGGRPPRGGSIVSRSRPGRRLAGR